MENFDYIRKEGSALNLAAGIAHPEIHFDAQSGVLEFSGNLIDKGNVLEEEIFGPATAWVERYFAHRPKAKTALNFHVGYFTTYGIRLIFDLLQVVEAYHRRGASEVTVNWYFDPADDDMREEGEDFAKDLTVKFNVIPLSLPEVN